MTLLEYWRLKSLLKMTDRAIEKLTMGYFPNPDYRDLADQWITDLNKVRSSIFESRSRDGR